MIHFDYFYNRIAGKVNNLITLLMDQFIKSLASYLAGLFTAILGYFTPVRDIVHLLIFLFIMDILFGFWASRKLTGARFDVKIVWRHTMPRLLISIVLTLGAFMWDEVYGQNLINTYKVVGWFISGLLLYSIAENGYYITKWTLFKRLGNLINSKIDEGPDFKGRKSGRTDSKACKK